MSVLTTIGHALLNSEYATRKRKKYQEDADYRYQLQEGLLFGTITVGVMVTLFGGIAFMAYKFPEASYVPEATSAALTGLNLTADVLENIAFTQEAQYFETPQGMFIVEFYGEVSKLF